MANALGDSEHDHGDPTTRPASIDERLAGETVGAAVRCWQGHFPAEAGLRVGVVCDTSQPDHTLSTLETVCGVLAASAHHGLARRGWAHSGVTQAGSTVEVLTEVATRPGGARPEPVVPRFRGPHPLPGQVRLGEAMRTTVSALDLDVVGPARLLVLIAGLDQVPPDELDEVQYCQWGLNEYGCKVLWLCPTSAVCNPGLFPYVYPYLFDHEFYWTNTGFPRLPWTMLGSAVLHALTDQRF